MKTMLYNHKKIALIFMNNSDYFDYWAKKANLVYTNSKLSNYEKIEELSRCVANMRFWKEK